MNKFYIVKIILVCFILSLLGGCSSIFNSFGDKETGSRVYIGVRKDIKCIVSGGHSHLSGIDKVMAVIDLPFSLVADTILLPYTIFTITEDHIVTLKEEQNKYCEILYRNDS